MDEFASIPVFSSIKALAKHYGDSNNTILTGSFLLKDEYGIYDILAELREMIRLIDADQKPKKSFSLYMKEAMTIQPSLESECMELAKTQLYGFYTPPFSEFTSGLASEKDKNKLPDFTSKFTFVDLSICSESLLEILTTCEEWEFYSKINELTGRLQQSYHTFIHRVFNIFKILFNIPIDLAKTGFMRLLNYQPLSEIISNIIESTDGPSDQAMSPHFDMTFLTIIIQYGYPALQMSHNGTWKTIDFKGCMLFQFGYLAQLLSQGRIIPMYHRVKLLPPDTERFVGIYFTSFDRQTVLSYASPLEYSEGLTKQEAWEKECAEGMIYSKAFENYEAKLTVEEFDKIAYAILNKL
jgi:isopenicillin N synthase-like dioxygenase